jgi:hypothetical protein
MAITESKRQPMAAIGKIYDGRGESIRFSVF